MKNLKIMFTITGLIFMGASASSFGATCASDYSGTGLTVIEGATVCFIYDSNDIDPIYGQLQASGDTIFATPSSLRAIASSESVSFNTASGVAKIRIAVKDNFKLEAINITESGDYQLSDSVDGAWNETYAEIFEWNNPTSGRRSSIGWEFGAYPAIRENISYNWTDTLPDVFRDNPDARWNEQNDFGLNLRDYIYAVSQNSNEFVPNAYASMGVTNISISIVTRPVPIPASSWLLMSGLIGLLRFAKRKK